MKKKNIHKFATGLKSLNDICKEMGTDWREEIRRRAKELNALSCVKVDVSRFIHAKEIERIFLRRDIRGEQVEVGKND